MQATIQTAAGDMKHSGSIGFYVNSVGFDLQRELVRKSIHVLIAFVPSIASIIGVGFAIALLSAGIVVYTTAEYLRTQGRRVFLISRLTQMASRERDFGHFVLGPVSLGLGAMLALLFYPYPAAAVAIYALAFGDGISSIIGKLFGRIRIPGTGGKTIAGSASCFAAVFVAAYPIVQNPAHALVLAATGTFLEVLPSKDFDNILLPVGVGMAAQLLLIL
ncbi:diacylglycerol/polyprenol kinase family protein [Spirochaeta dissipatitropha]